MMEYKILELFSGIGGMHSAFKYSGLSGEIRAVVDINTVANLVYQFNHPQVKLLNNNIQKLTPKFIEKLDANMILMSPPCQPFTRVGNQKDINDSRTDALKHICDILPDCKGIQFILMENVKGFDTSQAREVYLDTLRKSGFFFREFMLSPSQFGVPNTRYRYYCLARKTDFSFGGGSILGEIPKELDKSPWKKFLIKDILEPDDTIPSDLLLDDKVLRKRVWLCDIVNPESLNTICFTKAYTHYSEGTGSIFTPQSADKISEVFQTELDRSSEDFLQIVRTLQLRYFSPREVARLMSFPDTFQFPETTTLRQRYRLLGNSINVLVVGELIKLLCS